MIFGADLSGILYQPNNLTISRSRGLFKITISIKDVGSGKLTISSNYKESLPLEGRNCQRKINWLCRLSCVILCGRRRRPHKITHISLHNQLAEQYLDLKTISTGDNRSIEDGIFESPVDINIDLTCLVMQVEPIYSRPVSWLNCSIRSSISATCA